MKTVHPIFQCTQSIVFLKLKLKATENNDYPEPAAKNNRLRNRLARTDLVSLHDKICGSEISDA